MQTNFNTVIGGYNPEQWEDTTDMKSSDGWLNLKDITSGSPFLFYWMSDKIQIIKHRADKIPYMLSNEDIIMLFGAGLQINA